MGNFVADLREGEEKELQIAQTLKNHFPGALIHKNTDKMGVDLVLSYGVEVKYDRHMHKLGTIFIEYGMYKKGEGEKPTGLFKEYGEEEVQPSFWVYVGQDGEGFIVEYNELKLYVKTFLEKIKAKEELSDTIYEGVRMVAGGDGMRSRGLSIPIACIHKLETSQKIINNYSEE